MGEANIKLEKKKALFAENPDQFINLEECLLVVKKDADDEEVQVLNQCKNRAEAWVVKGAAERSCDFAVGKFEVEMAAKRRSGIVVAR